MAKKNESAIPVGTQFAPTLIDLKEFIKAIIQNSGNKVSLENAIWNPKVRIAKIKTPPTRRRKSLPLESARQYGLLTEDWQATSLAKELARLTGLELYDAFGKHILLRCNGLRVVEAAEQMAMDEAGSAVKITGDNLAAYLTDQGFKVTVHNTQINTMRLWLERAGIFYTNQWRVNSSAKERILGLSDKDISALINLSEEEKSFILALCRIAPEGPYLASTVREVAETIMGHRAQRNSLPKLMMPLKDSGFIDFESGGTKSGKSARVWTTEKFKKEILEDFLVNATKQLDAVLTDYYKRDISQIYEDLESKDTFVKGQALEAFTIQIMRRMGLKFVKWRLRAKDQTGGAEVDAVLRGVIASLPSRWQIQCKNTPSSEVRLNDVAKEVGLLPLTKATHILILANCKYSSDAIQYSKEVMMHSSVTIFLLDQNDFEDIKITRGGSLSRILEAKSHEASGLKRFGLDWLS